MDLSSYLVYGGMNAREIPESFRKRSTMSSQCYKDYFTLEKRNGGCGVIVNGKLYVWGGEGDRIKRGFEFLRNDPNFRDIRESVSYPEPEPVQENDKYCYCTIDEYDLKEGVWRHRMTHADSMDDFPLFGRGCTMVEINGNLYAFAGFNPKILKHPDGTKERDGVFANTVHCLNMKTFEWKKLIPVDNIHIPPPLYLCGALSYNGKLCVFGGMVRKERKQPSSKETRKSSHLQEGAKCHQYGSLPDKFWTNEYFEFDATSLEWSAPAVENRPSPCGAMTFTRISDHHAVMFGGNYKEMNARSDDLFIFDLEKKEFTDTLKPDYPSKWPPKLTYHTATCLLNPDVIDECLAPGRPPLTQKVLIAWGKDGEQAICKDIWLLEIEHNYTSVNWKKFPPQANMQPTAWHIAQPCYSDGIQECSVVVFGGNGYVNKTLPGSPRIAVNDLKILEFGVPSLMRLCLMAIHPIVLRYDLCQLDDLRKRQIEEHCHQIECKNTFCMTSIPLILL